jgi:hypothetical protein
MTENKQPPIDGQLEKAAEDKKNELLLHFLGNWNYSELGIRIRTDLRQAMEEYATWRLSQLPPVSQPQPQQGNVDAIEFAEWLETNNYKAGAGNEFWFKWVGFDPLTTAYTLTELYQIFRAENHQLPTEGARDQFTYSQVLKMLIEFAAIGGEDAEQYLKERSTFTKASAIPVDKGCYSKTDIWKVVFLINNAMLHRCGDNWSLDKKHEIVEIIESIKPKHQSAPDETEYLLSSPKNKQRIEESIEQVSAILVDNDEIKSGDKVKFVDASDEQVKWGNNDDPREVLSIDGIYEVEDVEVHSWHTKLYLKGIKGRFNSVHFSKHATTEQQTPVDGWIDVKVEFLFEFTSFDKWVNKGQSWFKPYNRDKVICIDKNGNCCNIGEDFMAARDNDLFPVKAYRLIRTIETTPPITTQ